MQVLKVYGLFRRRVSEQYQRSSSVLSFNHDGLEVARVKSRSRYLPLWHLVFFLYIALLIRLVVAADIGTAGYEARLSQMRNGNVVERAAASVMRMDPVSRVIAAKLRAGLAHVNERILDRRI